MKIRQRTNGSNIMFWFSDVPERIIIANNGTREKKKWTNEDTTTETGKIDLGRYNLFIRLRLLINAVDATLVP